MLVLKTVTYNYLRAKNVICFAFPPVVDTISTFYKEGFYTTVFSIKLSKKHLPFYYRFAWFIEKKKCILFILSIPHHSNPCVKNAPGHAGRPYVVVRLD